MREVTIERNTNETQIELTLNLDGAGRYQVDTGCGFLNHMLELFARHGRFDLVLTCHGDVEVDYHHTTEDVGIALGQAFAQALGDMRGIHRYGSFYLPMDEALILCAVDISGRCTLNWDIHCSTEKVGDFDVECAKEFWLGFARSVPATVHFVQFAGENSHHILEAAFKGLGMQLLFEKSCEYGEHDGLGFVPGQVCPLAPDLGDKSLKVPQIGWNAVHILRDDPLFKYVRDGEYFYYVHSYYGKNCAANTLAVSDYSLPVTGVVKAGKVYGTQFHPEKSGDAGLRLLKAFSEL